MTCWQLKQSDQTRYPDSPGKTHVYNNTHSRRVVAGDRFVYLDKRAARYAFNGHGVIKEIQSRTPEDSERTNSNIKKVYIAILDDFVQYDKPIDVKSNTVDGRRNRALLGIEDFNRMGLSPSVAQMDEPVYDRIVELAYSGSITFAESHLQEGYEIRDGWSATRRRYHQERFRDAVLRRQGSVCAICGTTLEEVLDVAHISPYATDPMNRANPANGIVMCVFCHRAFDRNVYCLKEDGSIIVMITRESDDVIKAHLPGISPTQRAKLIDGADSELLRSRYTETLAHVRNGMLPVDGG